jgi:Zn-dependent M28 family amino/carboxypeptidase
VFFVAILFVAFAAAQPAQAPEGLDSRTLMEALRTLASPSLEGRLAGSRGGREARRYIRDAFKRIGLETVGTDGYDQPFGFARTPGNGGRSSGNRSPARGTEFRDGVNLVGRVRGTLGGAKTIVITAHYDHLGVRAGRVYPGADDNASGVVALLAIAQAAAADGPRHPLIFAALDAEELGLQGARAFLRAPPVPRDAIALDINLDMVARGDKNEIYASGTYHYPWTKPIVEDVQRRTPIRILFGHDRPKSLAPAGEDDWTLLSDHGVFHQAGIPFVYFGVEDHADYHQPTDTADRIDPAFFRASVEMLIDAVMTFDRRMN